MNMTEPFLISNDQLHALAATRQGRVSIAGYNYQAAYAVARLASMAIRQSVLEVDDWPDQLRYDWGEDLDEAQHDGTVRFTQCKRVATIGQPASFAEVLLGFAPKWLWVQASERHRLRFRLVCSDPRFAASGPSLDSLKADVRERFLLGLKKPAGSHSDRAEWIADASAVGGEVLFEGLWSRLDCVYLAADVVDTHPAGPRLTAEKEALRALLERGRIDPSGQAQVLGRLRRLIHDNLISFDPTNESLPSLPVVFNSSPTRLNRADVNAAIDPWQPALHRPPPFQLVDRTFLSEQRELERQPFVARQPDWGDVAHGQDETIKFIERDQTQALESVVLERVVARIGRAGKLPTLFVAGAPGDGKTTITRRVAARLVDAGKLLIADAGVGLQEPPGEPDEYVQAIERLQSYGRPVVLLLDDPLFAESPWLDVLKKLNRPGLQVGVLAASPQFLLAEHKSQLRMCDLTIFEMARTSQTERESLAALYGRPISSRVEEDFLVVAMEMAAGVPFREIIDRLWLTLADGRDLSSAKRLSDLPWQTRAYLFVCFFFRAYEACPEPLLLKLLAITGGVPGTADVHTELERMKYFAGWRVFRIGPRGTGVQRFRGVPITAAHTVIARQAWEQRPLAWCDLDETVIRVSIDVPETIRDVSSLAVRLETMSFGGPTSGTDTNFAAKLIEQWRHKSSVETRHLCALVSTFMTLGFAELVYPVREELAQRAIPDSQGWLAALRLWFLLNDIDKEPSFPADIDLLSLIQAADFSVASGRATQFARHLAHRDTLRDAFVARLLSAFDGQLGWNLDSHLLSYLLAMASLKHLLPRVSQITAWLENHRDDYEARRHYFSFLLQLPAEFSELRATTARQTAKWLEEHGEDTMVRTQFLSFLLQLLPAEFSDLRATTARQTAKWLEEHDEDTTVRTHFLSFLIQLPAQFSELRAVTARQTQKWLEEHSQDTSVRTQYLSFLSQLPPEFSKLRADAARKTAKWLNEHRDETTVRTKYLTFLSEMKPVGEWQQLANNALNDAAQLTVRSGYQRRHATLVTSSKGLHLALLRSLRSRESEVVRKTLKLSHDVAGEWRMKNPSAGVEYDLPLLEG